MLSKYMIFVWEFNTEIMLSSKFHVYILYIKLLSRKNIMEFHIKYTECKDFGGKHIATTYFGHIYGKRSKKRNLMSY